MQIGHKKHVLDTNLGTSIQIIREVMGPEGPVLDAKTLSQIDSTTILEMKNAHVEATPPSV